MREKDFPWSYWTKILGLLIIVVGIISFFLKHSRKGVYDYNEVAIGLSWGLVFIFFSKEKTDDEMMRGLKFKALTRSLIIAFFITHLYNYLFLNWYYKRNQDLLLSISAYQFLALTLIIATISFYYYRNQSTVNGKE